LCFIEGVFSGQKCGVDELKPITRLWGGAHSGVQGQTLVGGGEGRSEGEAPEYENLSPFGCPTEAANSPHSPYFAYWRVKLQT